jgi:Xaa-Pro aminopeptidase
VRIAEAEFRGRLARLAARMAEERLDALVGYGGRTHYGSVRYLTGYEPWQTPEEWAFAVFRPPDSIGLISNSPWDFWEDQRARSTWVDDLAISSDWPSEILSRLPHGARRVGVAGWHAFPALVAERIGTARPDVRLLDATALLRGLRSVKSADEIALLADVGRMGDAGGRAFIDSVVPGATDREVAARVDTALMLAGSENLGYPTTLGSGPRTVTSCVAPSGRTIAEGDIVQLDCSPMLEGYKGDFSRATVAGRGSAEALHLLETVADAYEACAEMLRPGVRCLDVARVGVDVITRAGYAEANLYRSANITARGFMAHGIGLENPDPPGLVSLANETVLEEGMVVNLEPILLVDGLGGARIEGAVVVGPSPVALSTCPIRPWRSAQ